MGGEPTPKLDCTYGDQCGDFCCDEGVACTTVYIKGFYAEKVCENDANANAIFMLNTQPPEPFMGDVLMYIFALIGLISCVYFLYRLAKPAKSQTKVPTEMSKINL